MMGSHILRVDGKAPEEIGQRQALHASTFTCQQIGHRLGKPRKTHNGMPARAFPRNLGPLAESSVSWIVLLTEQHGGNPSSGVGSRLDGTCRYATSCHRRNRLLLIFHQNSIPSESIALTMARAGTFSNALQTECVVDSTGADPPCPEFRVTLGRHPARSRCVVLWRLDPIADIALLISCSFHEPGSSSGVDL